MEQLVVTREAIEACERRTGYVSIGVFFLRKGLFVLADNGKKQKTKVGSPKTSTSSTTSGAEEPKLSFPSVIKNDAANGTIVSNSSVRKDFITVIAK